MQNNGSTDPDEMKREESTVATGDVTVAITSDVQGMITQVSRDDAATLQQRSAHARARKEGRTTPKRRSFFSRFFCCASKSVAGQTVNQAGVVVPTSHSSFLMPRKASSKNVGKDQELVVRSGKKCLALDLDETLVHSSFQPVPDASFVLSVVIEGTVHNVYVMKRPGVDEFIERMANHYELIVFTASLSKYADPLLDLLDLNRVISKRLFREHCVFYDGHYVKDLSTLSSDITQTIIVDNSPMSYIFHPENAIDCSSFFDDPSDIELWQIADFLESIRDCDDVRQVCKHWRDWCRANNTTAPHR